jgi:prolipoprotein diacylglyceryl transferase
MMDAAAPGLLLAQGIGRIGNYFNQELYGKPTDLPWGLEIDKAHFSSSYEQQLFDAGKPLPDMATFHPTYLYEFFWNLAAFAFILWLERRYRLGYGRVMAVYVMAYTAGRGWIEYLRIDDVQLEHVLGLRFNVWTSIVLFAAAAIYFVWSSRRHPGREESVFRDQPDEATDEATEDPADDPADDPTDGADAEDPAGSGDPQDDSDVDAPVSGKVSTED